MKLSIILATRTRPGLLVRTVEKTLENIICDKTRMVIAVDDDDHGTIGLRMKLKDPRIIWSIEQRPDTVAEKFNRVLRVAPADAYMVMVDYAPCVTKGFDDKILEAAAVYPDGYAFIVNYLANQSFTQMNAITHKLAAKLGGIYPEHFPYWFVDHWFEDLSYMIGRRVFADILMDCSQKQPTMEMKEPYLWSELYDWLAIERRNVARAILDEPDFEISEAHKKALLRYELFIRHRSVMINEDVRASVLRGELSSQHVDDDDERYHRIKKKAVEIMEKYQQALADEGIIVRRNAA